MDEQPRSNEIDVIPIGVTPSEPNGIDEEWPTLLLAAVLSSVSDGAAAVQGHVQRVLGVTPRRRVDGGPSDAAIGLIVGAAAVAARRTRSVLHAARPVYERLERPPFIPYGWQPATQFEALAKQGRAVRKHAEPVSEWMFSAVVNAAAARIDVAAVINRIDIATIARQVVDDIELPDLIRESAGAVTSEGVVGVRLQGIQADERVGRIVDKVFLRRTVRKTELVGPRDGDPTAD